MSDGIAGWKETWQEGQEGIMQRSSWVFGFVALSLPVVLSGCISMSARDASLSEALIGKWSEIRRDQCCARYEQTVELLRDGKYRIVGVLRDAQGAANYSFDGGWRVENGYLRFTPASVPQAALATAGAARNHRIQSVGEWEWVMSDDERGVETRTWRYPK